MLFGQAWFIMENDLFGRKIRLIDIGRSFGGPGHPGRVVSSGHDFYIGMGTPAIGGVQP